MSKTKTTNSRWAILTPWTILLVLALAAGGLKYRDLQKQLEDTQKRTENIKVSDQLEVKKSTIMSAITNSKELISTKYYYTDIDEYEKGAFGGIKVPFTVDHAVFSFTGTIGIGVDLKDFTEENIQIDDKKKEITISMPAPEIMYHEVDTSRFESWNVQDSVFTSIDIKEYAQMEDKLKKKEEKKLKKNKEFWREAKENTETSVQELVELMYKDREYDVKVTVK